MIIHKLVKLKNNILLKYIIISKNIVYLQIFTIYTNGKPIHEIFNEILRIDLIYYSESINVKT